MNPPVTPSKAKNSYETLPPMSRLGFDIGRVILEADTDVVNAADTQFKQRYIPGSLEVLSTLVTNPYVDKVALISKCGPVMEQITRDYFEENDFFGQTGIDPSDMLFCRERREKGPIADKLGLTHFMDDRQEVLDAMAGIVKHRYLFAPGYTIHNYPHIVNPGVTLVGSWSEANELIIKSLVA